MNNYSTRSKSNGVTKKSSNETLFLYPIEGKSGRHVVTFTKHDENRLRAHNYLNDTVISFFMEYHLDNHVAEHVKTCIYLFSSFFFSKIKNIKIQEDKGNLNCASKWIKGVKIFDKDFLLMPICEKEHWILVIICYPSRTPGVQTQLIMDEDLYEPAVFVLNSSPSCGPRSVKKVLQLFLKHQWEIEKGNVRSFSIQNKKSSGIRLIYPHLPLQANNYNCGVYMLNYFYCFLKNPRLAYLRMFRDKDMKDWFKEHDIDILYQRKKMRVVIDNQIKLWKESGNEAKNTSAESEEICLESSSSCSSIDELVSSITSRKDTNKVIELH